MGTNDPESDLLTDDVDNQEELTDNQPAQDDEGADTTTTEATDPVGRWKGDVQLSKFKSLTDLEKAYKNLETKLGANSVTVPGETATDEEWASFFKRIGKPETPDGYELPRGNAPEEGLANFVKMCHEAGLTKRQAQKLWQTTTTKANEAVRAQQEHGTSQIAQWKKQVLAKAETDSTYLPTARRGAKHAETFHKLMKENRLSNHPDVINLFYTIGKLTGEDSIVNGERRGTAKARPGDPDYVWSYPNSPALK